MVDRMAKLIQPFIPLFIAFQKALCVFIDACQRVLSIVSIMPRIANYTKAMKPHKVRFFALGKILFFKPEYLAILERTRSIYPSISLLSGNSLSFPIHRRSRFKWSLIIGFNPHWRGIASGSI